MQPDGESYRLFLANYIDRAPVANSKLAIDESFEKSVFYDGGDQGMEQFYPLEFLAKLSCHIPGTYESITRYYGEYSYRRRGERKKQKLVLRPVELCFNTQNSPEPPSILQLSGLIFLFLPLKGHVTYNEARTMV